MMRNFGWFLQDVTCARFIIIVRSLDVLIYATFRIHWHLFIHHIASAAAAARDSGRIHEKNRKWRYVTCETDICWFPMFLWAIYFPSSIASIFIHHAMRFPFLWFMRGFLRAFEFSMWEDLRPKDVIFSTWKFSNFKQISDIVWLCLAIVHQLTTQQAYEQIKTKYPFQISTAGETTKREK